MLAQMDAWLAAIEADRLPGTRAEKVARNRPAGLVDGCYESALHLVTDAAECARLYPYASNPRIAAGEGWTSDRLKCALKPVDPADHG